MTFRQVTITNPVQVTRVNEDCKTIGTTPQRYFKIELKTNDYGKISMTIWEHSQEDIFEQLLYATDGLDWYDFPRIANIRVDGTIIQINIPKYKIKQFDKS